MSERSKTGSRRLLALGATSVMTATMLALPFAGMAHADILTLDATPESQTVQQGGTASFSIATTEDSGNADPVRVLYVDGSNAGAGDNVADGTATRTGTTTTWTYSYVPAAAGTNTLRFFGDNNNNSSFDAGEQFDDVTVTVAGPAFSVNLAPDSDSAAVGTCNEFTVSSADQQGRPNPGRAIIIDLSQPTPSGGTAADTHFCDPNGTAASADPATESPSTATPSTTRRLVVTTNSAGDPVVFGISSTQPGTETVTAWVDSNSNGTRDPGEPQDVSTKTWTAAGDDNITTVDAEPETANVVAGTTNTYTVTVKNSAGDPVNGVTVNASVTGANAGKPVTCGTTASNGTTTCSYTPTATGTDTIKTWVNKSTGGTPGFDAGEPFDDITRTITAAPATSYTVDLTCEGDPDANYTSTYDYCVNPTSDPTDVFTATVKDSTGNPVAGVVVDFSVLSTTGTTANDATLSPTTATTGADGKASSTLTNPSPVNGDGVAIKAQLQGGTAGQYDYAVKYWYTRAASDAKSDLKPDVVTAATGSSTTFTYTVLDQFGDPVVGQNVDFYVEGARSANTQTAYDKVTNASGQATFTLVDAGPAVISSNTVTAVADLDGNNSTRDAVQDTSTINYTTESVTPSKVDVDVTGACTPTTATTGSPNTTSNNTGTATNTAAPTQICALVQNASGTPLAGQTVTLTISGVGHFTNAAGTTDGGKTTTATTDANGKVTGIYVTSDGATGTQSITATAGSASDTGTITYSNLPGSARNISLSPPSQTAAPATVKSVTATVLDRFGNPVQGVSVTFTETGPGSFRNGTSQDIVTTGADGKASTDVTSLSSESGTQTVTATLSQGATDCELAAGTPTGSTAGNCTATSTINWSTAQPTLRITSPASGSTVPAGTRITISGDGCVDNPSDPQGADVKIFERLAGQTTYHQLLGGAACTNGVWTYHRVVSRTTYFYASGTNGDSSSIQVLIGEPFAIYAPTTAQIFKPGTRVSIVGRGGVPGEIVTIFQKLAGQSGYTQLAGGALVNADGTWLYRRVVSRTSYFYGVGQKGVTQSRQVNVAA